MSVLYYHCTDGRDLVIDNVGRPLGKRETVEAMARGVARRLMAAVPAFTEWSDWDVHVYDAQGAVAIVSFETALQPAQRRRGPARPVTRTASRRFACAA